MTRAEIIGTWETGVLDTELGPAHITLVFDDERLRATLTFDEEDDSDCPSEGSYELEDGWLRTTALFKGRPLEVWLEEGDLVLVPDDEPELRAVRR